MPRRIACAIVGLVAVFVLAPMVAAGPLRQELQVQITSPTMGQQVRGVVPIIGSASVPNFQFYKVEFGFGPNPSSWSVIGELHKQPVINAQLETWDTRGLPDGVYTLRLHGVKMDGNWEEFLVRQVIIANVAPTATPEPSPTPTAVQRPTTAVTLIAPGTTPAASLTAAASLTPMATRPLTQGTPTPTLSRPVQRQVLPIDLESWRESFLYGAAAMAAVFVVLGVVFGLRRLL